MTRQKPSIRRETIRAAAEALFLAHGFESVTMEQIASVTGVTRTAIYRYYPSTFAILDDLFQARLSLLRERLEAVICEAPRGQALRLVFDAIVAEPGVLAVFRSGGGPTFHEHRRALLGEQLWPLVENSIPIASRGPFDRQILIAFLETTAYVAITLSPRERDRFADNVVAWVHAALGRRDTDGEPPCSTRVSTEDEDVTTGAETRPDSAMKQGERE